MIQLQFDYKYLQDGRDLLPPFALTRLHLQPCQARPMAFVQVRQQYNSADPKILYIIAI